MNKDVVSLLFIPFKMLTPFFILSFMQHFASDFSCPLETPPLNTRLLLLWPHTLALDLCKLALELPHVLTCLAALCLHYPSLIREREETCIQSHSILNTSREGWVSAKLSRSCAASSLLPSLLSLPLPTPSMVLIWWHLPPFSRTILSIGRDSSLFSSWQNLDQREHRRLWWLKWVWMDKTKKLGIKGLGWWERMRRTDTCICMAESLAVHLTLSQWLLMSYTPI